MSSVAHKAGSVEPTTGPRAKIVASVALPSEHGGWAFLIEPLALGLLVAPSRAGFLLAFAAVCGFLAHQPLKIAVKDRLAARRAPRSVLAERFAAVYVGGAVVGLAAAAPFLTRDVLYALAAALPFAAIQFAYDARNRSRQAAAEISGALALATLAPAISLLGNAGYAVAIGMWIVLAARAVPSILYVRARLKIEHNKPVRVAPSWMAHVAALLVIVVATALSLVPWLVVPAFVTLFVRSVVGLSRFRTPRRAAIVGVQEILCGVLTVTLAVVGFR